MEMDSYMCQEDLRRQQARYKDAVCAQAAAGKAIILYGAGMYGRKILSLLRQEHIHIQSFAVTQKGYNLPTVMGVPVRTLDEVIADTPQAFFVLAVKPSAQGVLEEELQKRGITSYLCLPKHAEIVLDEMFFRPVMEITPRAGCSVNCRFCPQPLFLQRYFAGGDGCQREMDTNEFRGYVSKMPEDCVIDFSGFVEPFLAKDGLEMVKYAHESGHDVRLFTTLQGLSLEQFREIEDIPFRLVVLHLPDQKGYANIPVTEEYLQLLRYVVQKKKKDGSSFVDFANCQCEPHPEAVKIINHQIMITWDLIDRAGNLDDEALRSAAYKHEPIYCGRAAAYNHNVLLPNGDVVLCCMDFGMQRVFGNLKRQSYEEIMQGAVLRSVVRENGREGDALCRKCTYARRWEGEHKIT